MPPPPPPPRRAIKHTNGDSRWWGHAHTQRTPFTLQRAPLAEPPAARRGPQGCQGVGCPALPGSLTCAARWVPAPSAPGKNQGEGGDCTALEARGNAKRCVLSLTPHCLLGSVRVGPRRALLALGARLCPAGSGWRGWACRFSSRSLVFLAVTSTTKGVAPNCKGDCGRCQITP